MENKMNIPFSPPDITDEEIKEVTEALKSGWITTGPKTKQFEKELAAYSNTNRMVALNSATAAMELTLRLLGVGPGDEVIVPAYTYTASCSVICHVGATPIMVDIKKADWQIDYDLLDSVITEKTKVIIPVDLAGIICDYDTLYQVLQRNKQKYKPSNAIQKQFDRVIVMADAAHSYGATKHGKKSGEFADFTCYSFHAVKNLTTAEGGAVTWKPLKSIDDDTIYQQFQNLSLHGQTKDALSKTKLGSWEYDIISPAYKCNLTDIAAGIGLAQMKRYPQMLSRRHEIINKYDSAFKSLGIDVLDHHGDDYCSSGHLYFIRPNITLEQRNKVIEQVAEKGIALNVHYKPLPLLTAYKDMGFDIKEYPNAYDFYHNEITIPLYSRLTDEEVEYIINNVSAVLKEYLK